MKIQVKLAVSETTGHRTFTPSEDFDMTEEQWNILPETEKQRLIQCAIDELREHPYWCLDSFTER